MKKHKVHRIHLVMLKDTPFVAYASKRDADKHVDRANKDLPGLYSRLRILYYGEK